MEKIYMFLGLDPKKAKPLNELTKPGFEKENPGTFYRKGAVGDWKNYFTEESKKWFKEEAGDALILAGYEENLNW